MKHKPTLLYHGSCTGDITRLQPRKRFTPGELNMDSIPASIYATDDPCAAVAFALPWSTAEGFNLKYKVQVLTFVVPEMYEKWLDRKIFVYQLSSEFFTRVPSGAQEIGNFWSQRPIKPINAEPFNSVIEGIHKFGGRIEIARRYVSRIISIHLSDI